MAIISVSKESSGLDISQAEKLSGALGYSYLGREVAREAAERLGISPALTDLVPCIEGVNHLPPGVSALAPIVVD